MNREFQKSSDYYKNLDSRIQVTEKEETDKKAEEEAKKEKMFKKVEEKLFK